MGKNISRRGLNTRLLLIAGSMVILVVMFMAIFAPLIAGHDPLAMDLPNRYQAPTSQHWFGLDQNGSDVFAKVVYGSRVSLMVALSVVGISCFLGLLIGSFAGWNGGWIDHLFMRIIDMLYAFPGFLLALAMVAVLGPSLPNLVFALCITGWTGYARLVRAEVLHLRERDYVQGSRALGSSPLRLTVFHVWPNLVGTLVVQASFGMAGTIITESGLSFLGLGAPPETPTWGALLNSGRQILVEAPHVSVFPGLAVMLLVLGFNLFGDGLRDLLDPKKF